MSVTHKVRSFLWKKDTTWEELLIIAAAIVGVIALIGVSR